MTEYDFEGKRRGRPPTGQRVKLGERIPADLARRVREFADQQFMDRAEAVALLLERGLQRGEE